MTQATAHLSADAPRLMPALDLTNAPGLRRRARETAMPMTHDGFSIRHHESIAEIAEDAWNRLFPGAAEDWGYFRGCELSGSTHFTFSAVAAYDNGRLIAAAPVFQLDYRLDMTLPQAMKRIGDWLAMHAPRLIKIPVLGLGSPMTEDCPIGIDPTLGDEQRACATDALLHALEGHAKAKGIKILALKDVRDSDAERADASFHAFGFARMASLPVAMLPLPYSTFDDYIASLSANLRKDIRRKLKQAKDLQIEFRDNVDDVYEEIIALYRATRANRKASYEAFDEVPEAYFREVMAKSNGKARVMLTRLDGRLVSFNLILVENDKVIGKFVGMDYEVARSRNLYFVNWMTVVRFCIENGIANLQTGQTTYAVKLRLGCKLRRSWVYCKYTGGIIGPLVRWIAPKLSFEDVDPDLRVLGDMVQYLPAAN